MKWKLGLWKDCWQKKQSNTQHTNYDYDELHEALAPPSTYQYLLPLREVLVYTVPNYPKNHNPLLPLSLQQRLEQMGPEEFVKYILEDLSIDEREALLLDERQRRKTFMARWPHANCTNLSAVRMAQCGFYSLNSEDRVQCVFCRGRFCDWKSDDNIMREHSAAFNYCRFVKGFECGNREFREVNLLRPEDMVNIKLFLSNHHIQQGIGGGVSSTQLGVSMDAAAVTQYAPYASRLKSYGRWDASHKQSAMALCEAGFYYTGFDDLCRCYHCGGGIKEWAEVDKPWVEHARWFPDCWFLLLKKGEKFVTEVQRTTHSHKNTKTTRNHRSQALPEEQKAGTDMQKMVEICQRLNHRTKDIKQAITQHGVPYTDITTLVEDVVQIENSATPFNINSTPQNMDSVIPASDDRQIEATTPRRSDDGVPRAMGGCRRCEINSQQYNPANYIGLPCGHVIYCQTCADATSGDQGEQTGQDAVCPYESCGNTLSGVMKIHLV